MDNIPPLIAAHAIPVSVVAFIPPSFIGIRVAAVIAIATLCIHILAHTDKIQDGDLERLPDPAHCTSSLQKLDHAASTLFNPRRLVQSNHYPHSKPDRTRFLLTRSLSTSLTATTCWQYKRWGVGRTRRERAFRKVLGYC